MAECSRCDKVGLRLDSDWDHVVLFEPTTDRPHRCTPWHPGHIKFDEFYDDKLICPKHEYPMLIHPQLHCPVESCDKGWVKRDYHYKLTNRNPAWKNSEN